MMNRRSPAAALAVAAVVLGTATTAGAAAHHPAAPRLPSAVAAANRPVASWEMNEPAGASTMIDSSGNGRHGAIGGEVQTGLAISGAVGYRFTRLPPDTPPPRPQHVIKVPDHASLDPGSRDYAVTLRLRTTHKFGNIVQKGQATVAGGNFKLQIPSGILQCVFRGTARTLLVSSPRALNDGRWHTVRCTRSRTDLTLVVDGSTVARRSGWTGAIANSWPLSIGGKTSCDQIDVGCDYYAGDLDRVQIDAGP